MTSTMSMPLRDLALDLYRAGLRAAEPEALLREQLSRDPRRGLCFRDVPLFSHTGVGSRLRVFGAGKAAAHLARAFEPFLADADLSGRLIVKYEHGLPLERIVVEEASHPLPDTNGLRATERVLADLAASKPGDRILFLLTGGASALLVAPAHGLALEDKVRTTQLLLRCGASIQELNTVRKHLSAVKGGRLLEHIAPPGSAQLAGFVISDVVGDELASIGSGPAVADPSTFSDAIEILTRFELSDSVPEAVWSRLQAGASGRLPETPKPGAPLLSMAHHVVLASNRDSLRAARRHAESLGLAVELFAEDMVGGVHETAVAFARALLERQRALQPGDAPTVLLAGGELTLRVAGAGLGGRNQEFSLVAARELAGAPGVVVLSAGTDGTDGPTDAAGAFADGTTAQRARASNLELETALANNDAYNLFDPLGDLLRTGPTGTNVNDLVVGLAAPRV